MTVTIASPRWLAAGVRLARWLLAASFVGYLVAAQITVDDEARVFANPSRCVWTGERSAALATGWRNPSMSLRRRRRLCNPDATWSTVSLIASAGTACDNNCSGVWK